MRSNLCLKPAAKEVICRALFRLQAEVTARTFKFMNKSLTNWKGRLLPPPGTADTVAGTAGLFDSGDDRWDKNAEETREGLELLA